MISLFSIVAQEISTSGYDNLLHGRVVRDFERAFAEYVGAPYAVSFSSATNAIFLLFKGSRSMVTLPSMIPPVVANALLHGGNYIRFCDDVSWVGGSYLLHEFRPQGGRVIDSAQRVDRNQFINECLPQDVMVFSFYPTKPVGSCDGGMIVSGNQDLVEHLRVLSINGTVPALNSWEREIIEPGWKMYMNSIQADLAASSLVTLDSRKDRLAEIRGQYDRALGSVSCGRPSDHLYRIVVDCNDQFLQEMRASGIQCGIHYRALHLNCVYSAHTDQGSGECPNAVTLSSRVASLPFHADLSNDEVGVVIEQVSRYLERHHD